ncbi:MAG TPA: alpha/beta hydrolase [Polyangia bacterium]
MVPLLFIHGTGGDAASWDRVTPFLAERARVIAYDRRGFGRPHAAHAEDARAILDERAPGEAAIVVGASAGGIVALELAAQHPSRVRALVLVEPPLWARKEGDLRMTLGMIGVLWHAARKRPRQAAAAFFRNVTRDRSGGNGFDALDEARRERLLAHADDVLAELRAGTGESLTPARLGAIACPTTLILGARSSPFFARVGAKLAAAMPSLRTVTIEGAGHMIAREEPRALADVIADVITSS